MIHIDELVRSRLQGGEERERAGSWGAMRDLLEKELPQATAATGNRRLWGLLLLLLIGTSATVTGYQLTTSGGHGDAARAIVLADATKNAAQPSMATRRAEANEALNNLAPVSSNSSESHAPIAAATQRNPAASSNAIDGDAAAVVVAEKPRSSYTGRHNNQNFNSDPAIIRRTSLHTTNALSTQPTVADLPLNKGQSAPSSDETKIASTVDNTQVVTPDGLHLLLRRDSVQRIEIVEHHTRRMFDGDIVTPAVLSYDTISMAMLAVYKPVAPEVIPAAAPAVAKGSPVQRRKQATNSQPLSMQADMVTAPQVVAKAAPAQPMLIPNSAIPQPDFLNPALAAASPAVADDGNNLVSLSSMTTSSVKHGWWNPEQFSAAVNKMKFRLGGIEWYGGIEAGINGSFGNGHSLGGFQCALTGLVAINEILSVNTGLYFYQRYNTGSTVHDNYVEVDPNNIHYTPVIINNQSYNRYSWIEDTIDHHFNYDVMRTLELPILLRVSPGGRFFGEGGVNFVYGFKTNASEISNHAEHPVLQTQAYPTTQADPHFGSQSTIKLDDFGSRLGFGFAVGGGYHFSPAVTLNLRVSKTFWDNAKTDGSQKISTELFRLPNMQLSVGYRFSQQKASPPVSR